MQKNWCQRILLWGFQSSHSNQVQWGIKFLINFKPTELLTFKQNTQSAPPITAMFRCQCIDSSKMQTNPTAHTENKNLIKYLAQTPSLSQSPYTVHFPFALSPDAGPWSKISTIPLPPQTRPDPLNWFVCLFTSNWTSGEGSILARPLGGKTLLFHKREAWDLSTQAATH